jgi:peptidoglycan hydrolase-like protein with peptidoglycan-binding domain
MSLQTGSTGSSVRSLQNSLNAKGFNAGRADGKFGAKTASAVRSFQASKGLTADGKVGRQTQRALQAARNKDSFTPAAARTARRTTTPTTPATPGELPYRGMQRFAAANGFQVTSTTGGHHLGWAHRAGHAVDIRTNDHTPAQVDSFISQARAQGYTVIDERRGGNAAWSGPHIHLQQ